VVHAQGRSVVWHKSYLRDPGPLIHHINDEIAVGDGALAGGHCRAEAACFHVAPPGRRSGTAHAVGPTRRTLHLRVRPVERVNCHSFPLI